MMTELSNTDFKRYKTHLHSVLWLWLPITFALAFIGIDVFIPLETIDIWYSENGLLEIIHTAIICLAALYCVITIQSVLKLADPFLIFWLSVATFGTIYCAGEEISWGQHIFGWQSNEFWSAVNDQGETNFHNTSSWLDQKPRIIVEMGIVISGLIIPALQKWHPHILPVQFRIIYTNAQYVVCAAIFLAFKAIDSGFGAYSASPFFRGSELLEHFMFYYILMYMIDFHRRMLKEPARRSILQTP
jgi:hypothetical protein